MNLTYDMSQGACSGLLVAAAKDTMTKQDIYTHESEFIDHIA